MKILIVNGFGTSVRSFGYFSEFETTIKDGFILCSENYSSLKFITKDKRDLCDFIYHPELGFDNHQAISNFDSLSLIFIGIEADIRPWEAKCKQVLALLSLIRKTNKPCFLEGMGAACFAYTLATEPIWQNDRESTIINRSGSPLKYIEEVNVDSFSAYKNKQWVLDNITGDIYEACLGEKKLRSIVNSGMKLNKKLHKMVNARNLTLNNLYDENPDSEKILKCKITYEGKLHWLAKRLSRYEFSVLYKNNWDLYEDLQIGQENKLEIIGKAGKIPLIVAKKNVSGVLFYVLKDYPETVQILFSFIEKFVKKESQFLQVQNVLFQKPALMNPKFFLGHNPIKLNKNQYLDSRARPVFPKQIPFLEKSHNILRILRDRINFYTEDPIKDRNDKTLETETEKEKKKIKIIAKRYNSVSRLESRNFRPSTHSLTKDGKSEKWVQFVKIPKNRSFTIEKVQSPPKHSYHIKLNATFSHS
ncbi:unnamed protein product [Blepharisma stoltei]|uniref:Site-specific DNA endonuclease n=1 Tax=Blepharisma stoltei TaxID=1481888 RepID=A0AAU9J9P9_9CILI|nr:unnamed protein product [Blepharisma stoltei]